MTKLNSTTLSAIAETVPGPQYDRSQLSCGIVHFGVGGFHRGHQAFYLDALMNQGKALDWGICGVGVMPSDQRMRDVLVSQDYLYTLVLKHPDGAREPRVIGSIIDYLYAPDDPEAVIAKMAAASTRIVSLTVTEGGYNFDQATGEFIASNPDVVSDLAPGALPRTVFGFVTEALQRRRENGIPPFVVVSCDNIQGNGQAAKKSFVSYARLKDRELADWIERSVRFPNSMVDRITPGTTDADRSEVLERYGFEDGWPVVAEPFVQWVLEDEFDGIRPPYEDAGVQLVDDVEPYELMKLRLLNASHQGIAYFGYLAGYRLVHEAAQDPLIARFLLDYMDFEATPTLRPLPGIDLDLYKRTLIERFSNGEVRDTIARLCLEASDRIPKWLVPVVKQQLQTGGEIRRSAAIIASWARYAEGIDEHGAPIEIVDNAKQLVLDAAARQAEDPLAFVRVEAFFGDMARSARFASAYTSALASLHEHGARATLEALVADSSGDRVGRQSANS